MIHGSFSWGNKGAIQRHIDSVRKNAQPNSTPSNRFKARLLEIVRADHIRKLEESVDKMGRPLAPLAPSTLKNRRRGKGGPLNPPGSRFKTNFTASWAGGGLEGKLVLVSGFQGIPFAIYHMTGTRRLPKRDLMGVTRKGMIEVEKAVAQYARDILKYGG
jgi:hypothetical protein